MMKRQTLIRLLASNTLALSLFFSFSASAASIDMSDGYKYSCNNLYDAHVHDSGAGWFNLAPGDSATLNVDMAKRCAVNNYVGNDGAISAMVFIDNMRTNNGDYLKLLGLKLEIVDVTTGQSLFILASQAGTPICASKHRNEIDFFDLQLLATARPERPLALRLTNLGKKTVSNIDFRVDYYSANEATASQVMSCSQVNLSSY